MTDVSVFYPHLDGLAPHDIPVEIPLPRRQVALEYNLHLVWELFFDLLLLAPE